MQTIEEFKKTEITIGEILKVEDIEGSDKLLKLTVDFAEENPRTIVSGIKKHFPDPEVLVGVKCAFVTNLEPRPLMGLISEGMIMAASTDSTSSPQADEAFSLLRVSPEIPAGTKIN